MSRDSHDAPVSAWIERIKEGDSAAEHHLWHHFMGQILAIARRELVTTRKAVEDEDDVVNSVFKSLFLGARNGQFEKLSNRKQLWSLLYCITLQKATNVKRRTIAKKRGGNRRQEDSVSGDLPDLRPTHTVIVEMREQLQRLLDLLESDDLKRIAVFKLQGYLDREIAEELNTSIRTVERKTNAIRTKWYDDLNK